MFRFLALFLLLISCSPKQNQATVTFSVSDGESFSSVAKRLHEQKIINNTLLFRIYAKLTKQDSRLKVATYLIKSPYSYSKILSTLTSGKGVGTLVTIPEGYNAFQIAELLEKNNIVSAKEFLAEISKEYWLTQFQIPTNSPYKIDQILYLSNQNGHVFAVPKNPPHFSLEGYLFPDSYSLEQNMTASNVVQTMIRRFNEIVNEPDVRNKILASKKNLREILSFASIIQKEASHNKEMPRVAGVYQNRLNINMILQADPTIIYSLILDGVYDGNIRTRHLRPPWPSPYNTYYTNGLPPGPIANPGKEAILASLNPEKHSYLYFVAQKNGEHKFSKTLKEHNEAVKKWVEHRRGN